MTNKAQANYDAYPLINQAIISRYLGPTNHRGTRVSVKTQVTRIVVDWDYSKNANENHHSAAMQLVKQLGWDEYTGHWVSGALPNGDVATVYVGAHC